MLFVILIIATGQHIAFGDFDATQKEQQDAYANYFNDVFKLQNPTQADLNKLKTKWLDPANEAFTEAQQTELRKSFPQQPLPKEITDPKIKAKAKEWHRKRFNHFLDILKKIKNGKAYSALPKESPLPKVLPSQPSIGPNKDLVVEGDFPKEIIFSKKRARNTKATKGTKAKDSKKSKYKKLKNESNSDSDSDSSSDLKVQSGLKTNSH